MSTTNEQAQGAFDLLKSEIMLPHFLQKLASRGIAVTEADVHTVWGIGQNLMRCEQQQITKEASETSQVLKLAAERLDGFMVDYGLNAAQSSDRQYNAMAREYLSSPQVKEAAALLCGLQ